MPSSLPEGSPSLAAGLCEQDAAEQTSLFLLSIEGALIKPGNPRPAARGFLESCCCCLWEQPQAWHLQPRSRARRQLRPAGLGSACCSPACACGFSHQSCNCTLKIPTWMWGRGGRAQLGAGCSLPAPRREKCRGSGPRGAAQRVPFWMSSSAIKKKKI